MGDGIDVSQIFLTNGMPRTTIRCRKTLKSAQSIVLVVRMRPAVFGRVPVLVTRFKGMFMTRPNQFTGAREASVVSLDHPDHATRHHEHRRTS